MLNTRLIVGTIVLLAIVSVNANKNKTYQPITVYQVVDVKDGDTFSVNIKGYPGIVGDAISIRIAGIDCPELTAKQPKVREVAKKAKAFTKEFLDGAKKIELRNVKRGKYFRIVADVYVDEKNLGMKLVQKKLARPWSKGKKENKRVWKTK